ncbi:MAG: TIGR02597 family protein [Verrucomicrobiota bacterium]
MHSFIRLFAALALAALCVANALAQTATTDPVGFTTASLLSGSDTLTSVPFTRPPEFTGAIQSTAGSVITVAGTPGWNSNQFVYAVGSQPKTYYALIGGGGTSNPKEGHTYTVTANGSNTLTVNTAADTLTGITANTQLVVIPYWTPATIFPASDANVSFTPTTSTATYKTELLVPNNAAAGTNLPVTTYFFSNNVNGISGNVGWRLVGDNTTNHGDDPLLASSYFVVRNLNGAPTLPVKGIGGVLTKKLATALRTSASGQQDNAVSMVRPVDVTLNQSGLSPVDGSFMATPPRLLSRGTGVALKDQLLLFDNTAAAYDKQPSATYYYSEGPGKLAGWKLVGDGSVDHGDDFIPAGSAIVIRKAKTAGGATVFWTNAPTY